MSSYALSPELKAAIGILFSDPAAAYSALGIEDGEAAIYQPDISASISLRDRVVALKRQLEHYLAQMALESREVGCDETTDTLRMQGIGLLIALREIQRHVPEVAQHSCL